MTHKTRLLSGERPVSLLRRQGHKSARSEAASENRIRCWAASFFLPESVAKGFSKHRGQGWRELPRFAKIALAHGASSKLCAKVTTFTVFTSCLRAGAWSVLQRPRGRMDPHSVVQAGGASLIFLRASDDLYSASGECRCAGAWSVLEISARKRCPYLRLQVVTFSDPLAVCGGSWR